MLDPRGRPDADAGPARRSLWRGPRRAAARLTDELVARIVVAGYGNPLRGDDGVGWRVAEAVAENWGERVCVLMGQQPAPEWAPELAAAELAFLVDATHEAVRGVCVRRLEPDVGGQLLDGHTFGPAHLLGLAAALFG